MDAIKSGDKACIHYIGRFEDGSEFDSSYEREPIVFTAGGGELIPGVSQAVIGMRPGEKKTVEVPPELGYGLRDADQIQRADRGIIPADAEVGSALQAKDQEGRPFVLWVAEIGEDHVLLDANHPLAGRVMIFEIEVLSVPE